MPQSINYTSPTADLADLIQLVQTSLNFGLIHEEVASAIESVVCEILLKYEEYGEDNNYEYTHCGLEELFDLTEDKEYVVQLFRNSIFVHTNYENLWEYDDVAQEVLDLTV